MWSLVAPTDGSPQHAGASLAGWLFVPLGSVVWVVFSASCCPALRVFPRLLVSVLQLVLSPGDLLGSIDCQPMEARLQSHSCELERAWQQKRISGAARLAIRPTSHSGERENRRTARLNGRAREGAKQSRTDLAIKCGPLEGAANIFRRQRRRESA